VDALLLALAVAIGSALRYWLGRRDTDFLKLASALLAGLVIVGGASLALSRQLHYVQGQSAERTGAYALAVAQYKLYGEAAPNAPDVARADTAWGEQLMGQKRYADAAKALSEALTADPKDTTLVARASRDLYSVYSTWLSGNHDNMPYGDAATFFAQYRTSSACDATCQTTAAGLEAETRFLAGTQLAAVGNYAQAVVEFDTIQAQFPTGDYAAKAHTSGAQAYLAYGKQLLADTNTCKGAVSASQTLAQQYQTLIATFQTLVTKYADTPEGKQGAQMMAAPQPVSGTLTDFPPVTSSSPAPTIHLSKTVNQAQLYFSNNYNSTVDAKSGAFSFANVTPGDYNLHTERDLGYKVEIHIIHNSSGNLYNIHVGALCPLNLGAVPYTSTPTATPTATAATPTATPKP
jgi:tetratricopeptide (TPR) repeat protein